MYITIGIAFLCMMMTEAHVPHCPNSFLKNLSCLCRDLGWTPKCSTECNAGTPVAFQVRLARSIASLSPRGILKYDTVVTNIGDGYSLSTGKFTAPVDGIYSFSWTYMTRRGAATYIGGMLDGKLKVYSGVDGQTAIWQSTTGHLITKMKRGSKFWTSNINRVSTYIHDRYTFLSGHKVSDY